MGETSGQGANTSKDGKGGGSIIVELDTSNRARSFDESGSFFGSEITRVLEILEQDVKSLPDDQASIDIEEQMLNARDVICVYGSRGAGKTSFLRSVGHRLRVERKDLHVLPLLDPTLIERNEVFLATIVSNVLAAIEKRTRRGSGFSPLADDVLAHNERLRETLDALARAFRLLAPGGIASSWGEAMADPHLFAHEVLQDAASGRELAVRFHTFVAEAARAIGVRAFVQPLDDVDTAYGQGWHVLETTRKYLSTRIFIPMISGDLDLYRMLVRSNQIEHVRGLMQFEQAVGGGEASRADLRRYQRQIDQLEEQYLLKVMPAERRVRLRSVRERVWDKASNGEEFLSLDSGRLAADKGRRRPLSGVFAEYCEDVFGWRRAGTPSTAVLDHREWAVARLLPARTRSLISLFQAMVDWVGAPEESRQRPVDGLARVFRQALVTRDVDDTLLDALVQGHGLGRLGAWALRWRGEVAQLHLLDPERVRDLVDAEEWTQTVLTLNAALFQRWRRDPGSALRFGAKVVQPALFADAEGDGTAIRRVINAIALEANEPAYRTATRQQALIVGEGKDPQGRSPGLIWLPRRTVKDHKQRLLQAWMRHLKGRGLDPSDKASKQDSTDLLPLLSAVAKSVAQAEKDAKKSLTDTDKQEMAKALFVSWTSFRNKAGANLQLLLDWFGMTLTLTGGSQLTYLSADRGLAALGDLLERASRVDRDARSSVLEAAIRRFIREALRDATAFAPSLKSDNVQPVESTGDEDDELLEAEEFPEEDHGLREALVEWTVAVASGSGDSLCALPPYIFARVVTRWWANVEKLNDADTLAFRTAGGMLHRWLAAFLHAHLIEEVKLLGGGPKSFRTNATDVGLETDSFEKNLQALLSSDEGSGASALATRPVATAIWMACPLIRACLAPGLRQQVLEVSRAVLGTDGGAWADYLTDGQGGTRASVFEGRLDRPQLKIHDDVQVLLTALYAPEAREGDRVHASTYKSGRARLAALSGLDFDNIDQSKSN